MLLLEELEGSKLRWYGYVRRMQNTLEDCRLLVRRVSMRLTGRKVERKEYLFRKENRRVEEEKRIGIKLYRRTLFQGVVLNPAAAIK